MLLFGFFFLSNNLLILTPFTKTFLVGSQTHKIYTQIVTEVDNKTFPTTDYFELKYANNIN